MHKPVLPVQQGVAPDQPVKTVAGRPFFKWKALVEENAPLDKTVAARPSVRKLGRKQMAELKKSIAKGMQYEHMSEFLKNLNDADRYSLIRGCMKNGDWPFSIVDDVQQMEEKYSRPLLNILAREARNSIYGGYCDLSVLVPKFPREYWPALIESIFWLGNWNDSIAVLPLAEKLDKNKHAEAWKGAREVMIRLIESGDEEASVVDGKFVKEALLFPPMHALEIMNAVFQKGGEFGIAEVLRAVPNLPEWHANRAWKRASRNFVTALLCSDAMSAENFRLVDAFPQKYHAKMIGRIFESCEDGAVVRLLADAVVELKPKAAARLWEMLGKTLDRHRCQYFDWNDLAGLKGKMPEKIYEKLEGILAGSGKGIGADENA